ncbi:MAG: hypothetical protein ACRC0L_04840 [Angustibacter sp.]
MTLTFPRGLLGANPPGYFPVIAAEVAIDVPREHRSPTFGRVR